MTIGRPEASEYDPYYETYVSKVEGSGVVEELEAQIEQVEDALANLDDEAALFRYEPGKWSIKEMVGHLIDTERVFAYRALCIARGESESLPGMDHEAYLGNAASEARPIRELVTELRHVRRSTVLLFQGLPTDTWRRVGVANGVEISVRALAFVIAGHLAHHLGVLRERYGL